MALEKILITALFWVITQRGVVIPDRRFGTNYRAHLQESKILERSCLPLRGGSLKSRRECFPPSFSGVPLLLTIPHLPIIYPSTPAKCVAILTRQNIFISPDLKFISEVALNYSSVCFWSVSLNDAVNCRHYVPTTINEWAWNEESCHSATLCTTYPTGIDWVWSRASAVKGRRPTALTIASHTWLVEQ